MSRMNVIAHDASTAVIWHTVFEMTGIFAGMRLFVARMQRHAVGPVTDTAGFVVATGCILGAIAGSKLAVWIDRPDALREAWGSWRVLLMGQSIVGALIGGLVGVEVAKRLSGIRESTGDAFVLPLAIGIAVGRVGCFIAGLHDDTYGIATQRPWGVDFGDGIRRHPTQLYDVAFVVALAVVLFSKRAVLSRVPGLSFKLFLAAYLLWRLAVDALKPVAFVYPLGLSGLQWLSALALAGYAPFVLRALHKLHPGTNAAVASR